jgi:hypothetical protein
VTEKVCGPISTLHGEIPIIVSVAVAAYFTDCVVVSSASGVIGPRMIGEKKHSIPLT